VQHHLYSKLMLGPSLDADGFTQEAQVRVPCPGRGLCRHRLSHEAPCQWRGSPAPVKKSKK